MSGSLEENLYSAAVFTFERVAFLVPDIPPDPEQRQQPVEAVASVEFSGPACGTLQLHAGNGLLPLITANMVGMDDPDEALQLDALGELANIICGQFLPALDPVSAFEHKPPEIIAGGDFTDEAFSVEPPAVLSARAEIGFESSRADVLLFLHPDARSET